MVIEEGCDSSYMENIDTIFKNFTKCKHCIHSQVCSFKTEQKELINKIETHLDNENPSKIFNIILKCKAYQPNEDASSKMQY